MGNNKLNTGITKLALGATLCASLMACGGGGDGGSTPATSSTATSVKTTGTAATGSPISGATVQFKCASGASASATTNADGTWSVLLNPSDYPCAVRATGGQVNGQATAISLYSIAAAPGNTNVTPLADLMVAALAKQDPGTWFANVRGGDLAGLITSTNLASATASLKTQLATLPGKPTLPNGFDPLTSTFTATKGDAGDDVLEVYGAALIASGLSQADAEGKSATSSALTQAATAATAYTTPGLTSFQIGLSQNLDGSYGLSVPDITRGTLTSGATVDADSNITALSNTTSFSGVVSLLGNRIGELCTSNGVGSVIANHPGQYVYVSKDLTEVTDPSELNDRTFSEYEDCVQSGTTIFQQTTSGNGAMTFTSTDGSQDAPVANIALAFSTTGLADQANHSVKHAKAYKYVANGVTKYVYITVNSTTTPGANDDPLTFDADTKYVTIGLSQ
ncbi:carboxypeptidase-like regulatory domain-containing protein [Burkholderia gladioli]|uniref:carboxypeptidase-like regulatory domain-containing protein n=1 Tax=Burkholderia gladioli TaxID=28095 RepID=UPI002FE42407